jgi:hypothetical protein
MLTPERLCGLSIVSTQPIKENGYMKNVFCLFNIIMVIGCLVLAVGCNQTNTAAGSIGEESSIIEHDNLKSIEIENLNDENNSRVVITLPEVWHAKEVIFEKAPSFEYSAEKNKHIKKVSRFDIYNSTEADKYNLYGDKGLAGEFYVQGYYRDQPESTRFPNHCSVKSTVYSGEMVLGQGEIFILNCDLPKEKRTEEYSTFDMVYVWIPIEDEALAYNLSISVPPGEKGDEYTDMVKEMLNANTPDTES